MQHHIATQTWTDQRLDTMRQQGDPLADTCFEQLRTGQNITRTSDLFKLLQTNNAQVPANAPAALQDFLNQTQALPACTDRDRIKRAEELFMAHAFLAALVLLTKSLPAGYAAPNLAQVLHVSGNLEQHPYKRTLGVLQMVVNVSSRRGFEAGGEAIITAQKLRLLHAGVRYIVRQHLPEYAAQYGVPVNQEDMLGTIMGFSYLVIEGLRQLHAGLSPAAEEDYYYLWRIYAQLMGIFSEYVPENVDDARTFYQAYARRHYVAAAGNPVGVQLATADLDMLQHMLPRLLRYLSGSTIPRFYLWELLGPAGCTRVEIQPVWGHAVLKWILYHLPRLRMRPGGAHARPEHYLHETLSHLIFQGMINRAYDGQVTFLVPETIADLHKLA